MEQHSVKLTQYSHGAGCGCKIAPSVLDVMLQSVQAAPDNERLLVGNHSRDDAAVYDLGTGMALISTTDFFMPIVDDPFEFGKIAATNAISDVYAMGGKPILAIAILGWPINTLAPEVARRVIEGGRAMCAEAGIPLAGGHSIDSPEPIFGLAVNGLVAPERLKRNNTAQPGDRLFLTKPLGVGIITTAEKKGIVRSEDAASAIKQMTTLNTVGAELSAIPGVHAMTDVTGFGLLGHLSEMLGASGLEAELFMNTIPLLPNVEYYLEQNAIPGGTKRNWDSYGASISLADERARYIVADPQTSGGLLLAVAPSSVDQVLELFHTFEIIIHEPIGVIRQQTQQQYRIIVTDYITDYTKID